ncbi:MAG: hypothetical protein WCF84_11540 [Anaerolineae bacterium]
MHIVALLGLVLLLAGCTAPSPAPSPVSTPPEATQTLIFSPSHQGSQSPAAPAITVAPSVPLATATNVAALPVVTRPATRMIFASPNQSPLAWARLMVQNVQSSNTSYQHKDILVTWAGVNGATDYVSYADCSGWMNALLTQTFGLTPVDFAQWLGARRPLAKDYFAAIGNRRGLTPVTRIADLQAGDLIVIRYLNSAPGDNTGHVLLAAAAPQPHPATKPLVNDTRQWDVAVIDSSESGHGKADTRRLADGSYHDGVGQGVMRLYTDNGGTLVGYTWSDFTDSTYYDAATRPLAVGRIDPQFSLP